MTGEKLLGEMATRLEKALGDALVSVLLFGSAAAGDAEEGFSDLNLLCVLRQVTPREMEAAEPALRWWRDKGNPAPLLLSEEEVRTSTDCFAIEFHDLQKQRRVLAGADVIAGLEVDDSFYRARVECELRAKLLRLRQKAAGVLWDKELLRRLMADSVSTFCVLIRHALALHGVEAGAKKREVVAAAAQRFGVDPAPFEILLNLREGTVKPGTVDPVPVLERYLAELGKVIAAVDRLDK